MGGFVFFAGCRWCLTIRQFRGLLFQLLRLRLEENLRIAVVHPFGGPLQERKQRVLHRRIGDVSDQVRCANAHGATLNGEPVLQLRHNVRHLCFQQVEVRPRLGEDFIQCGGVDINFRQAAIWQHFGQVLVELPGVPLA